MMTTNSQPMDAGYTLTEILVALAVGSLLILGVGEITRLTARAYYRVTDTVSEVRAWRGLDRWLTLYANTDLEVLTVTPDAITGGRGESVTLQASLLVDGEEPVFSLELEQFGTPLERRFALAAVGQFEYDPLAGLRFRTEGDDLTMVSVPIWREVPYNCRYDTVSKRCR
jgi:prepilin-type N-terminal cleavage/methylation domain-containing protein